MALRIDIKGHISDLKAKLGQARASVSKFGSMVGSKLVALASSFGATLLGMFAFRSLITHARGLINHLDKIGKASAALGVSTKVYQEMAFAAQLAGSSMEKFKLAMSAMGPFMLNAAAGGRTQAAVLERLNLNYKELSQLKPEEQFRAITAELDKVANATERVGLARAVFGRAGLDVLNMARNLETARNRLAGSIISEQDIAAAESFNDEMALLYKRFQALAVGSGAIRKLAEEMEYLNKQTKQYILHLLFIKTGIPQALEKLNFLITPEDQIIANENKGLTEKERKDRVKRREELKAAKDIKQVFDAMGGKGGGGDRERYDQFRRIGALGGFSGGGGQPTPVLSFLEQWGPLVRASVEDINRKTPDVDPGGRN